MKLPLVMVFAFLCAIPACFAGDEALLNSQVDAATSDAVRRLEEDIHRQLISPRLTVGDFLKETDSSEAFANVLRRADQIGGPRWVDSDTCQVKLTIDSDRLRRALVAIANDHPRQSPLPGDAVMAKLRSWDSRTFAATGSSISARGAEQLRPIDQPGPWQHVTDQARRQTLIAARDDAYTRLINRLDSLPMADGKTLSQILSDPTVANRLHVWFADRPVTRVEFRKDLTVEMNLCAEPREIFDALSSTAATRETFPKDSVQLANLQQEIMSIGDNAVGNAQVQLAAPGELAKMPKIPSSPPSWVKELFATEAKATFKDSSLKTARRAEETARDLLRTKIDALPLGDSTIGEAAKRDPAIDRAVQQALGRAHAYKIDYLADRSVDVKVSLDSHDLWDALREMP